MTLSTLPLSYCTNVHPGRSVAEVERGLDDYTVRVQHNVGPLAAGLWLAQPVVQELLHTPDGLKRFAGRLTDRGLVCYTLNTFPYGDFHSPRVKEQVYIPDWSDPRRLQYTLNCAQVLTALLPVGVEGSLSSVPLGFKSLDRPGLVAESVGQLLALARGLDRLCEQTGQLIRLAIEPEPLCLLERTEETVAFFETQLRVRAAEEHALEIVNRHLGVCLDVCHQAVEFEDLTESIAVFRAADVRINKVHITCALQLDRPSENQAGREALARYVEPRYLHQTFARTSSGQVITFDDLTAELALHPSPAFRDADLWRIHFHVPVDAEQLGPLKTTRSELRQALAAAAQLDYAPHLEVETYTWQVLPGGPTTDLVSGLTQELLATNALLTGLSFNPKP